MVVALFFPGMVLGAAPGAAADSGSCGSFAYSSAIACGGTLTVSTPAPSTPSPAASPRTPATTIPPANIIYTPNVGVGPTGQLCVSFSQATGPNLVNTVGNQNDILSLKLLQTYGLCPATPVPPALAANPVVLAEQFWQTIPLPSPRPAVPPGFAVTGKPAYLVTNGTTAPHPWTEQTPLGTLSVSAHGTYLVEWGDGANGGPYPTEGLPYPDGTITHTYDTIGRVDITVTEAWSATWRLGAAGGTLQQLQTVGRLTGFPVEQIQAVITH